MTPTILIVDDEPDVLLLLRVLLEAEGFKVRSAADGMEALETIQQTTDIRLVVTDLMMPRMDGIELIQRLRSADETSAIPVVVVSARGGPVDGADAVFAKPFSSDELVDTCRMLLAG